MDKIILMSDESITCKLCGFISFSYKDMILHLAKKHDDECENCYKTTIILGEQERAAKQLEKLFKLKKNG